MRKFLCFAGSCMVMLMLVYSSVLAQDSDIAAKIGDKKITLSDFNKIMGYLDPERQKMIEKNPQLKETLLRQYVQTMVISKLARKKEFDKKPSVREKIEFFKDNYLANEYLKKEVADKVTVPADELKSYYDTHQEEFKTPEMVKARHILIKVDKAASESDKKKAREKAEDILTKIKAGEDFAKLATEMSDDPGSKQKGGDLGFFPKGRMVKPFEEAAFALKPGEVSGIVETPFGYHIIKVEEKKEPSVENFDTVKERISQKLLQERMKTKVTEFIEKAMKDAKAEIYPEAFTGGKK